MPYLKKERKDELANEDAKLEAPGELNYLLTLEMLDAVKANRNYFVHKSRVEKLVKRYIEDTGVSYTNYNNAIGALMCAAMELERRIPEHLLVRAHETATSALHAFAKEFYYTTVAPYEDQKIAENGDVH